MNLIELGWGPFFEEGYRQHNIEGLIPARVSREDRHLYLLLSEMGELVGQISGRFAHEAASKEEFPGVGDWVLAEKLPGEQKATIHAVLPRKSCFARQAPGGRTEMQVVAANVDNVFIVSGLDGGRAFNLRRIERYLALAWESGASPVVVLNKVDVCDDVETCLARAESIAIGVPVHAVSAIEGTGVDELREYLAPGRTVALLGSSGVGKSALVNALLGEERQATGSVRANDLRGRHTTVRRELIVLGDGGMIVDTPGMRELQVLGDEQSVTGTFSDIEDLAMECKFRDCQHGQEAGCAVHMAIGRGELDAARFDSYLRLQREMAYHASLCDEGAKMTEKKKWKKIRQWSRQYNKEHRQ